MLLGMLNMSRSAYRFIVRTTAEDMRFGLIGPPAGKWKHQK